ncbi:MAG: glycine--tRNA ligase subunit beta [Candidatus Muproteobacteria bacterium RBG_16_65_31]|uniref:Glycine--tRNA ligase beta subunit n=1 Tax=Candidatus Muproteobacteria bacterium RBG_16_65_31 TaxID=1817759 RepID=A0A1F6TCI5_9PROT|nr:MAG: glycine--tRNA ligase subunit beta [Candidatus Muproteobacteria bacterium RBG_16_65_31]
MIRPLLVEVLTEELPPKALARLMEAFARNTYDGLKEKGFVTGKSVVKPFATPRRLAVLVSEVLPKQLDRVVERRGPAVSMGLDPAGNPTQALLGFARSCGVEASKLERRASDKGEHFVHVSKQKGEPLAGHLAAIVEAALRKLPAPKTMRWGSSEAEFVRPVHGLIMLHGAKVVPGRIFGIASGNKTSGHRFLSRGAVAVTDAKNYENILERKGWVIADPVKRAALIDRELDASAKKIGGKATWSTGRSAELIDEVTSMVEYPAVYAGEFGREFLSLPEECLVISMQQHQRYFPLTAGGPPTGGLTPHFLFVSNIKTKTPQHIVRGNERVLRARLSDAKFFFDQDRKTSLAERAPRLANVVYLNKLGSQLERVERITKLAVEIAGWLADTKRVRPDEIEAVEQAARLCKADLLTEMVGEFPELQGVMGKYYALHDGLPPLVAEAIEQHYLPRAAGGPLPENNPALCVALADKLDALAGIYGIGLVPTGEKDPHGLRRAALGVARILVEKSLPLDVLELLARAAGNYPNGVLSDAVTQDLHGFILERLRPYLREQDFAPDEIEAVLVLNPTRLDQVVPRLAALRKFRAAPEGQALAAANKRIRNILRQAGGAPAAEVNEALLKDEAEKKLARAVQALHGEVTPLFRAGDYAGALKRLASLRPEVDEFFDKVMVMADDAAVRNNRLALLNNLGNLFLQVADISRLQG